jgi:arylsulfatase/uncharacterized sulfatase
MKRIARCTLTALGLCLALPALAAGNARPNIVVLLADDWGFSDVGSFGGEISTPNIDALAQRGMRFSNFHVSASCSPTRSMLLTGVDNHRNGVGNMRETIPQSHVGKPGYLSVLDHNVVTVASLLQESGYRTYVAGKWHVGKEPYNLPDQRGFDRSLIQGDSGSDNWETARTYLDLSDKVYWFEDGKPASMPADYYSSKFYVDKAIEYIDSGARQNKPFFAYVAFQANHIPVQAPRAFIDKYKGRYKDGWTALRQQRRDKAIELGLIPRDTPMVTMSTTTDWNALSDADKAYQARRMEVYAGMADAMDFHVGRLIAHLKQTGEYDNTVFVFMSDNGSEASDPYAVLSGRLWLDWKYNRDIDKLGDKGAYSIIGPSWASAAASPLSTYKFYSGEGGIRVPLIIAGAPGMQANQINRSFAHINDIAPTLLQIAQVAQPGKVWHGQPVEPMTGASLLPVLQGQSPRAHAPDEAIGYELSGNQALFKGDLKLIRNIPPVGDGLWHLYDIVNDPGETRDLSAARPQEFQTMQAQYADWAKANGVLPMPEGYSPIRQVEINALINVYIPRFRVPAAITLAVLVLLSIVLIRRRRRSRAP